MRERVGGGGGQTESDSRNAPSYRKSVFILFLFFSKWGDGKCRRCAFWGGTLLRWHSRRMRVWCWPQKKRASREGKVRGCWHQKHDIVGRGGIARMTIFLRLSYLIATPDATLFCCLICCQSMPGTRVESLERGIEQERGNKRCRVCRYTRLHNGDKTT